MKQSVRRVVDIEFDDRDAEDIRLERTGAVGPLGLIPWWQQELAGFRPPNPFADLVGDEMEVAR